MAPPIPHAAIAERFREIRSLLSYIKATESCDLPPVDSEEVKILRGLFYVHLYGVLERSLNDVLECFLQAVSSLQLKYQDLSMRFLPTAMNSHFKSLSDVQSQKKWQKRVDFVCAIQNGEPCKIESSVFALHLQSSETNTISEIANYLGITTESIEKSADRYYVDEVVNKRHQVAHGRTSPAVVGARGRSGDLELRLGAVRRMVDLFAGLLEKHYESLAFLNTSAQTRLLEARRE
ncbi:MAE_28990/MAE_18760 family HEPN-like nuclease [Burkholderia ubonensis]|uniref:MAE_28990/MAE_18760 family HEPN-like nuclease n=1 Tax=Burkholderia ubonensis TaxID=101571 RepID=UPI000ACE97A0|nr:MAE_28990/MAE_18760 family HEPN-like nuclease [Burkholderia ubonensis]